MKKLKLFLTSIIAMFVAVVGVHAEECEEVKVNGACSTLAAAVLAAQDDTETTIDVAKNFQLVSPITIDSSKKIVLNLNGFNIEKEGYVFYVKDNASLKITGNGVIKNTADKYYVSTDKTISIYLGGSAKLIIDKDVTIDGWDVINFYGSTNAQLDLYGTLISHEDVTTQLPSRNLNALGASIYAGSGTSIINVHDGAVIDGTGMGMYLSGNNKTTIGKALVRGATGIAIKSGELILNGSTVIGTYENLEAVPCDTGVDSTGAAIQVETNNGYEGNVKIHINGGTYTSEKGYALQEYADDESTTTSIDEIEITEAAVLESNAKDDKGLSLSEKFADKFKSTSFIDAGTVFLSNDKPAEDVLQYTDNMEISESGVVGILHKIEITTPENGKVEAYKNAVEDEEVIVKITADKGYEINTITIIDKDGKAVIFTSADGGVKFKMPASDVKLTVTFKKSETLVVKPETTETTEKTEEENPKTGDNILMYLGLGLASVAVAAVSVKKLRKTN